MHVRGAIPNEVGPTHCRATPALNQPADETRTPASQRLPAMEEDERQEQVAVAWREGERAREKEMITSKSRQHSCP